MTSRAADAYATFLMIGLMGFVVWLCASLFDRDDTSGILLCSVDGIDVFRSERQERIDDHGAYYTLDGRKFTPPERSLCEIIKE